MPCESDFRTDYGQNPDPRVINDQRLEQIVKELDHVTRIMCDQLALLATNSPRLITKECAEWKAKHDAQDAKRLRMEKREQEKQSEWKEATVEVSG